MKKTFIPLLSFLAGMFLTAMISWKDTSNKNAAKQTTYYNAFNPDARPVISLRKVKLKPGVSSETFEQFAVKIARNEYGKFPGLKTYFAKGDRGDETGSYIYVMEFDSKVSRNFYAPVPDSDDSQTSAEAKKFLSKVAAGLAEFSTMADIVPTATSYTDYVALE